LSELTRPLALSGEGELHAVLSDDGWRLVFAHGGVAHDLVSVDPRVLSALLLNRDLREAPGAPHPETREATAQRMADTSALLSRLRAETQRGSD
jgi:hypothetical protein